MNVFAPLGNSHRVRQKLQLLKAGFLSSAVKQAKQKNRDAPSHAIGWAVIVDAPVAFVRCWDFVNLQSSMPALQQAKHKRLPVIRTPNLDCADHRSLLR